MKNIFLVLITLVPFLTKAQVTLIPDQNFEYALVGLGIDSDGTINGQILTTDAQNAIQLNLGHGGNWYGCCGVSDFTGLEAFTNCEEIESYFNDIDTINLTALTKLKKLHLSNSFLSSIDLSGNINLESLFIGNDYYMKYWNPNHMKKLDLSNNTKLKYVYVNDIPELRFINMRNHTADSVAIYIGSIYDIPFNDVCIEVDDYIAATNGNVPYDTWTVFHISSGNHFFSDDCKKALNNELFIQNNFKIYPNPAMDYVAIEYDENIGVQLRSVQILDSSGKWVRSVKENFHQITISDLSSGVYLFVIQTDKGNKTEKVVVK